MPFSDWLARVVFLPSWLSGFQWAGQPAEQVCPGERAELPDAWCLSVLAVLGAAALDALELPRRLQLFASFRRSEVVGPVGAWLLEGAASWLCRTLQPSS